jgi:SAM-dependent methyltransferase
MNALEHWHRIITAYRQRMQSASAWRGDHADWYDAWIRENDYAQYIYPIIQPMVSERVLEIGAGTGIFTRRLVRDAGQVTALDPSGDMLAYLSKALDDADNLGLIEARIEDVLADLGHYDFILAAHALFNVMEIDWVLDTLVRSSNQLAILIGTGQPLSFHGWVRAYFQLPAQPGPPPNHQDLCAVMDQFGIAYAVQIVETPTVFRYKTRSELFDKLANTCEVPEKDRTAMECLVMPYIHSDAGSVWYEGSRQHAVVTVGG